jgi:hypothetical protein
MYYTVNPQFFHRQKLVFHKFSTGIISLILIFLLFFAGVKVNALPVTFDAGLTLSNQDLTYLPKKFDSAKKIQEFLEKNNSYLADYKTVINFELEDKILTLKPNIEAKLQPISNLQPYLGQEMTAAQIIWDVSRNNLGNGCNLDYSEICIDNSKNSLNPAFILALIQKESGLIYGKCNNLTTENTKECPQSVQFRLERAVGYFCFEGSDKTKSCYNENPNWRFFKGFFRQVYYASRFLRLRQIACDLGGKYAFNSNGNIFATNNTVKISDQEFVLKNGITCALYIYTPHTSSQKLLWMVLRQLETNSEIRFKLNLPAGYKFYKMSN